MKNCRYLFALLTVVVALVSCGSDGSDGNPFDNQVQRPFYPEKLTFKSVNKNAVTTEIWTFDYNTNSTIHKYTYKRSVEGSNLTIIEEKSGELFYYEDYNGRKRIENKVKASYTSRKATDVLTYNDELTEDVTMLEGLIQSINTTGKRNTAGVEEAISNQRIFTYSNEFCTGSTYKEQGRETTHSYTWNGNKLTKVTAHSQSNTGSELTHDVYDYSYNGRSLATNYGFNTLAFIYGHNPQIYAAMGLFGKTTPYMLELEIYNSSEKFNGETFNTQSVHRSYNILESGNSIIYNVDSPSYNEYIFTFSK